MLGLDTSDYSFNYVARWSDGATDVIKETGERVIAGKDASVSL